MAKRKVLVTGATGYLASQMLPRLRELFDLTLIDVKDTDPTGATTADLTHSDLNRYRGLCRGIDTVVHLEFHRGPGRNAGTYTINTHEDEHTNVGMAREGLHHGGNLLECVVKGEPTGHWSQPHTIESGKARITVAG